MLSVIFMAVFLFIPEAFCGAAGLSFNEARVLMQSRNEALKASAANVESRELASDSLKYLHGPTISVGAAEIWGEARIDVDRSISTPDGSMPIDIKIHIILAALALQ